MRVEGPVGIGVGNGLPSCEVNQVGAARRNDLRHAGQSGIGQPVPARMGDRPHHQIADLRQREIQRDGEIILPRQRLEGHSPHAGGMKHRHFKSPFFQRFTQVFHVFKAG